MLTCMQYRHPRDLLYYNANQQIINVCNGNQYNSNSYKYNFFFNIYICLIINKKLIVYVTTLKTKFMKFWNYNIDSQLLKYVEILNI